MALATTAGEILTPAGRTRSVVAAVLVLALIITIATQLDNNLAPFLTQEEYQRVIAAADYVHTQGWTQPILVAWGLPGLYDWSLLRSYLGDRVGRTYVYYGKLQSLYFLVPPWNLTSYRSVPDVEQVSAQQNFADLIHGLGSDPAAIRARPVVMLVPDSYSYTLSELFVQPYEISGGVYVIPPNALTELEINTWNLSAASDFTWTNLGSAGKATWSVGPWVLNVAEARANQTFGALYPFSTTMNNTFTLRVHLWDEPSNYTPVTFLVDGVVALTHQYADMGPEWLSVSLGALTPGSHTLEVVSGVVGQPLRVSLDVLQIQPA